MDDYTVRVKIIKEYLAHDTKTRTINGEKYIKGQGKV